MGIHDINSLLKRLTPRAFAYERPSKFSGKRIAIDGQLWCFANFSVCYTNFLQLPSTNPLTDIPLTDAGREAIRKLLFERASSFVSDMFNNGITPVFVFDGESVPEKTSGARERRKRQRDGIEARVSALRAQIMDTDPLFRKGSDVETLRNLLRQQVPITPRDIEIVRAFLHGRLGVPVVLAPDEAEKFCSYIAAHGFAAAVWSTDTDTYAFGAPLVISGSEYVGNEVLFKIVIIPIILSGLGLTRAQFVDLCIMLECDFNTRLPGVGPARAWAMISAAVAASPDADRLIEIASVAAPNMPWENLNAERCREIFLGVDGFAEVLSRIRSDADLNCTCVSRIVDSRARLAYRNLYEATGGGADDVLFSNAGGPARRVAGFFDARRV